MTIVTRKTKTGRVCYSSGDICMITAIDLKEQLEIPAKTASLAHTLNQLDL